MLTLLKSVSHASRVLKRKDSMVHEVWLSVQFSSVAYCVQLFSTPWTAARQASLSITTSRACSNSCPLSSWCHPTISSSVVPFSSCLQSFLASGSFPMSQFFTSGGQSIGASASFQWIIRTDFLYDGLAGSPCSLRDSQESSPTPQFKSISFSALSFLYTSTLTSIHDYWKNHSLE